MLSKFFRTQLDFSVEDDWSRQARQDLADFQIPEDLKSIESMSKECFKSLVKKQAKKFALNHFNELKKSHSKMKNIQHQELKMQDYLSLENITVNQAKILLKFRTRMANYGQHFKGTNKLSQCQLCDEHLDSQDTIFQCKTNKKNFNTNFNYDDIFLEKIEVNLIKTLETIYKFKENEQVKKK